MSQNRLDLHYDLWGSCFGFPFKMITVIQSESTLIDVPLKVPFVQVVEHPML